ncbi:MAG TPA: hypothetical protein VHH35_04280 [Pyrinomonadaceae bacterium]|nr:hypothetical protein [Pyrinomonadaceae bacterium]
MKTFNFSQQLRREIAAFLPLSPARVNDHWRQEGFRKARERGTVHVYYQTGDPEAQNLADNLREALSENGWAGWLPDYTMNDTYGEINVHANNIDPRFDPLPRILMDGLSTLAFKASVAQPTPHCRPAKSNSSSVAGGKSFEPRISNKRLPRTLKSNF